MAKLVFGMQQSLDGYVDDAAGTLCLPEPGPALFRHFTDRGRIDEYRLYFRPFVLGHGKPYFTATPLPLRLIASDLIGEDAVRLTYVPA